MTHRHRSGVRGERIPRYQSLARRLEQAIESGALRVGDKLPSVQRLHRSVGVGVSTALRALAVLEDRGLIEARFRSGHYVRARHRAPPPRPARPAIRAPAVSSGIGELVTRMYRAASDPKIVQLGLAIPTAALLPTREVAQALAAEARRDPEAQMGYQMPPGLPALRRELARQALDWGCVLGEEDFVITNGATDAILVALLAVTRRGDAVAIESPAFHGTLKIIEALGLKALEIPCHPETGMDLDELERRMERFKVAAVVAVPNFSNPLGSRMPEPSKERLVRMLEDRRVPLIEDDVFGDLSFDPDRPRAAKAYDSAGGVILCGSVSKSLAPGLRVGWAAPGRYRDRFEVLKSAASVAAPTLPQRAVARLLREGGYHRQLRTLRRRLSEIAERLSAAVAESFPPGTRLSRPTGGCALWVELPGGADAMTLHGRALEAGVSIAPGAVFSATGTHRNCIRLGYVEPWSARLDQAVRLVGRLAAEI